MAHAIRVHQYGGPEVLKWEGVGVRDPLPNEVRLRHTAVGLNFVEVMQRLGLPEGGLRIGIVHYNTADEVDRLLRELESFD